MRIFKHDIRLNTFLKKGLPKIDDRFGVYFITGRQGSGKNYYACTFLDSQDRNRFKKIKTNVTSLKIPGFEIEYFDNIEELYFDTEEYVIYLIDEVSRKYNKSSKTDVQFYAWLNQSRKRKRIVLMITQEWRELPMWIRRPAKYMITTIKTPLLYRFGIYTSIIGDAENMVFDKDEGEYNCPPVAYITYKRTKNIANYYDTFEAINHL